jgi:hypothetical protein
MSIATTRAILATHQALIPGIVKAFPTIPRSINLGETPCFITFIGRSNYDLGTMGEQMELDVRIYDMVLFGSLLTDKTEGEAESDLYPFIPLVKAYFEAHRGLEHNSVAVYDSALLGDAGIRSREFPQRSGRNYVTMTFQIQVREIASIVDAV